MQLILVFLQAQLSLGDIFLSFIFIFFDLARSITVFLVIPSKNESGIGVCNSLFLSLKDDEIFSKTVPAKLQTYMALGKPIIGVLKGEGATIIKDSRCGMVEENYNYVYNHMNYT